MSFNGRFLIFISLSMPEGSLRELFTWADGRNDVQFILRGWGDLVELGGKIARIKGEKISINVMVHPNLFRKYEIEVVPVYLVKKEDSKWYRVIGDVGPQKAEELAGTLQDRKKAVGEVYAIAEPDMLELLERRISEYDWEGAAKRAEEKLRSGWFSYAGLNPAPVGLNEREREYSVDPSVAVSEDITLPDGRVVVKAGASVNPLDFIGLNKPVVVFNPERRCEVSWVLGSFKDAYYMATKISVPFMERFKREVFVLVPEAVERFGLRWTPSVVWQDGRIFRVRVEPCEDS